MFDSSDSLAKALLLFLTTYLWRLKWWNVNALRVFRIYQFDKCLEDTDSDSWNDQNKISLWNIDRMSSKNVTDVNEKIKLKVG